MEENQAAHVQASERKIQLTNAKSSLWRPEEMLQGTHSNGTKGPTRSREAIKMTAASALGCFHYLPVFLSVHFVQALEWLGQDYISPPHAHRSHIIMTHSSGVNVLWAACVHITADRLGEAFMIEETNRVLSVIKPYLSAFC